MLVHSTDTKATVTILNMYTGALIREEALARPATQIIPLPARVHEGLSDQLVFLFGHVAFPAADTLPLVVYPDSPEARAVAIAAAETTFTWAASKATGALPNLCLHCCQAVHTAVVIRAAVRHLRSAGLGPVTGQ